MQTPPVLAICAFSCAVGAAFGAEEAVPDFFSVRGGIDNCRLVFEQTGKGRVVYLGGSITTMGGWRALTYDLLKKRFPDTEFDFIDAGIGGTDSSFGAYRFETDVFKNGRVDLLFLEYAVNDAGADTVRASRAMEGIIRHARRLNPKIDIIVQYFVDKGKYGELKVGTTPRIIQDHDRVVAHYNLPALNLAAEMTRRLEAGKFTWEEFSRDSCHPLPYGHEQYAQCIDAFLTEAWADAPATDAKPVDYVMPAALDPLNYEHGRFIPFTEAEVVKGWGRDPAWKAEKTCNYSGAVDVLVAQSPGDELVLEFEGTLIGYSGIAGMDAGEVEYQIDEQPAKTLNLFDRYCPRFHRPVCHVFADGLAPGKHTLRLRMTDQKDEKSEGHAMRIQRFVAN